MDKPSRLSQIFERKWLLLVLWGVIFALAYAPAPLYTSNQNQYFLQGLARAGYGNLSEDWLVGTQAPTVVFSYLVYSVYSLLHWEAAFYLLYGILAVIFLLSLYAIGMKLFKFSGGWRWVFLTSLVGINSAAVRFIIVRVMGIEWVYLLDGGAAGQRILGEVLQPSAFGVLLLASIACFLYARVAWAVVLLILAPVVHPTYLIGAALLTLLYMALDYRKNRKLWRPLAIGLITLLGVLPIVIHTYSTFTATDPETLERAREVLVTYRIPHHAIPAEWFNGSDVARLGFIGVAFWILYRKGRQTGAIAQRNAFHILLWPAVFVVGMTTVVVLIDNYALALLFPWRVSVVLVPLAVTIISGGALNWLSHRPGIEGKVSAQTLFIGSLSISILLGTSGFAKTLSDYRQRVEAPDRPMMAYVEANKQPGELYLIPLKMQDFRLETGAPAYTEFKSIPYRADDVLGWYHRVLMASRVYRLSGQDVDCDHLHVIYMEARISHVVLPADHMGDTCERLKPVYLDEDYGVYRYLP